MNQLELLWQYQQADIEADNLETQIRRSPKRQKLVKLRDSFQDLQKNLKQVEDEVLAMLDRMDALKDAISLSARIRSSSFRSGFKASRQRIARKSAAISRKHRGCPVPCRILSVRRAGFVKLPLTVTAYSVT